MGGDDDQTNSGMETVQEASKQLQESLRESFVGWLPASGGLQTVPEGLHEGEATVGRLSDDEPVAYDGRARYRFNYKTGGWQRRM